MKVIHRAGLRYHKEKRFIGGPAEMTGVIVNGDRIKPPNRQLKKMVETLAALRVRPHNVADHETTKLRERMSGLRGQLAQIAAV